MNKISLINWNKLFIENYGYQPQSSQSLTTYQSALWRHQSVMLFTTVLNYKSVCKTYLIISDSEKGKDTEAVYVDFLCYHFDDA